MILRPYQTRARAEARQQYAAGARAILYVAPTGAGKTVILGDTACAHVKHVPDARIAVYAHRGELIDQAARTFRAMGLEVGCRGEGRSAPVQILSTQAVTARGEVERCTMAQFDEAHHYAADLWGTVATVHKAAGAILVGATATPERGDGRGLGHMFDALVTVAQPKELVAIGALVPVEVVRPSRRVPRGKVARTPAAVHVELFRGRRNVVFAPHVKAAEDYAAEFALAGINVRVVEGKMHATDRAGALADFLAGEVEVLVNCMVLTEGWDCPPCEVVTIARDCGSTGMFLQMAGRGARPSHGKSGYTLCDLRGVTFEHGRPDDDREYSLDRVGISKGTGDGVAPGVRICKRCGNEVPESLVCPPPCNRDHNLVTPDGAGIALEAWRAEILKDAPDKRVARLSRWIGEAIDKGWKPGHARHRFKATYGHFPDTAVWTSAEREAREKRASNG